jgi:hypothetical protein
MYSAVKLYIPTTKTTRLKLTDELKECIEKKNFSIYKGKVKIGISDSGKVYLQEIFEWVETYLVVKIIASLEIDNQKCCIVALSSPIMVNCGAGPTINQSYVALAQASIHTDLDDKDMENMKDFKNIKDEKFTKYKTIRWTLPLLFSSGRRGLFEHDEKIDDQDEELKIANAWLNDTWNWKSKLDNLNDINIRYTRPWEPVVFNQCVACLDASANQYLDCSFKNKLKNNHIALCFECRSTLKDNNCPLCSSIFSKSLSLINI